MLGKPCAMPLTSPEVELTVASAVLLLLHVPPPVTSVIVAVEDTHTLLAPPGVAGKPFTVTVILVLQPEGNVYIIVTVPAATPCTIPVAEPTVAVVISLLAHVPPPPSVRVVF